MKVMMNVNRYVSQALLHLYTKGTAEINAFHKPKQIKRFGYELESVVLSNDQLIQNEAS